MSMSPMSKLRFLKYDTEGSPEEPYIHYYPRVTLNTYLPVKRIGNKFLVLPGDNNGYHCGLRLLGQPQ